MNSIMGKLEWNGEVARIYDQGSEWEMVGYGLNLITTLKCSLACQKNLIKGKLLLHCFTKNKIEKSRVRLYKWLKEKDNAKEMRGKYFPCMGKSNALLYIANLSLQVPFNCLGVLALR